VFQYCGRGGVQTLQWTKVGWCSDTTSRQEWRGIQILQAGERDRAAVFRHCGQVIVQWCPDTAQRSSCGVQTRGQARTSMR
jgi:hypothetical protein